MTEYRDAPQIGDKCHCGREYNMMDSASWLYSKNGWPMVPADGVVPDSLPWTAGCPAGHITKGRQKIRRLDLPQSTDK